mmetsp:Transcript_40108/g.94424  ORF Transcript_40108/g.94424 Transcript_40108/m.94424 type:complete len:232 (-) Transcript_40108:443-1138(-)
MECPWWDKASPQIILGKHLTLIFLLALQAEVHAKPRCVQRPLEVWHLSQQGRNKVRGGARHGNGEPEAFQQLQKFLLVPMEVRLVPEDASEPRAEKALPLRQLLPIRLHLSLGALVEILHPGVVHRVCIKTEVSDDAGGCINEPMRVQDDKLVKTLLLKPEDRAQLMQETQELRDLIFQLEAIVWQAASSRNHLHLVEPQPPFPLMGAPRPKCLVDLQPRERHKLGQARQL